MPKVKKAVEAVEEADMAISEAVADQRHRPLIKALAPIGEAGDQPETIDLGPSS